MIALFIAIRVLLSACNNNEGFSKFEKSIMTNDKYIIRNNHKVAHCRNNKYHWISMKHFTNMVVWYNNKDKKLHLETLL